MKESVAQEYDDFQVYSFAWAKKLVASTLLTVTRTRSSSANPTRKRVLATCCNEIYGRHRDDVSSAIIQVIEAYAQARAPAACESSWAMAVACNAHDRDGRPSRCHTLRNLLVRTEDTHKDTQSSELYFEIHKRSDLCSGSKAHKAQIPLRGNAENGTKKPSRKLLDTRAYNSSGPLDWAEGL
ncbi:hypothetical protein BJV77DRAFT_1150427, partial [Russula vinacea]